MFGQLKFTPDEYYRMGFVDMVTAIEGFSDGQMAEANRFRHLVLAPAWAMGSKAKVRDVFPLPVDEAIIVQESMSKDEFLQLAKIYKNFGVKAKA